MNQDNNIILDIWPGNNSKPIQITSDECFDSVLYIIFSVKMQPYGGNVEVPGPLFFNLITYLVILN